VFYVWGVFFWGGGGGLNLKMCFDFLYNSYFKNSTICYQSVHRSSCKVTVIHVRFE